MITVNMKQLMEAVMAADTFELPDINDGTRYLYENLYCKLSRGEDVRLSGLNFDEFDSEDLTALNNLYTNVLEKNERTAHSITAELRHSMPVYAPAVFV
jgi:hypothetical protein